MDDAAPVEVCLANITRAGRRRRLVTSIVYLAFAAGAYATLRVLHAPRWLAVGSAWVWLCASGVAYFQVRQNT